MVNRRENSLECENSHNGLKHQKKDFLTKFSRDGFSGRGGGGALLYAFKECSKTFPRFGVCIEKPFTFLRHSR